jgi:predicted transposase YbfD/YdcC
MRYTLKKTVEWIISRGHQYVICVKGNQRKLHTRMIETTQTKEVLSEDKCVEKGHGRSETRVTRVFNVLPQIQIAWPSVQRIIEVHRYGTRGQEPYDMKHYYISSVPSNEAKFFAQGIRGHWGIENRLHWVKDALMKEDKSPITQHAPAKMMALLRASALSIYRVNGYDSWKESLARFSNKISKLANIL